MASQSRKHPCIRCGVREKEPGRGKRFCPPCKDVHERELPDRLRELSRQSAERARRNQGRPVRRVGESPDGRRWCARCEDYIPRYRFAKNTSKKSGVGSYCRDHQKQISFERNIKKNYGLTAEAYFLILESQGGVCFICKARPKSRMLAVDHDHDTGVVRGLLCTLCNHKVLGGAKEDSSILRRAADYLDDPPAIKIVGEVKPDRPYEPRDRGGMWG